MATRIPQLSGLSVFRDLPADALAELEQHLTPQTIRRGETLVRQGDMADALYVIATGRFEALLDGRAGPVAEFAAGEPIGEIAFFAGGERTATLKALRDSIVLKLDRAAFDQLALRSPGIWNAIAATLARRLAHTTSAGTMPKPMRPRTLAVIRAGAAPVPPGFLANLEQAFAGRRLLILDEAGAGGAIDTAIAHAKGDEAHWFNDLEMRFDTVVYVADDTLTPWSERAIRQADLVLCVGRATRTTAHLSPNPLEDFAARLHGRGSLWLVLLHDRPPPFAGTRAWLDQRPWVRMHHHLTAATAPDFERLVRFITGTALGLVVCGGGAFSAAHIGIWQALLERGADFDIFGGTSGGAAMAAGFVQGAKPDDMSRAVHEIFVKRRAMRRWTWPRYSLLDPRALDMGLAEFLSVTDIEDLPKPFFAVATNLTRNETICLRRGPLWHAVRASSSIPALLPPVINGDGDLLIDGCLRENVPIETMHAMKDGPNIVLDFLVPAMHGPTHAKPPRPSRLGRLFRAMAATGRPEAQMGPSAQSVLMRSLMLHNRDLAARLAPDDHLLAISLPEGIAHLDWHRHQDLRRHAYTAAREALAAMPRPLPSRAVRDA